MRSRFLVFSKMLLLGCALIVFQSCSDDDDPVAGKGNVSFEITDAAADDANIKSVFITVADIKVDGESVGLTNKQTIDLTAYANGDTKLLGTSELDAKTYSKITLVLDNSADASGNSPGNYVLTTDDTKYELTGSITGTTEVTMTNSWSVMENTSSKILLDFDLRKAIKHIDNSTEKYHFVAAENLSTAIRVIEKDETGTIEGSYTEDFTTDADMVVAYAYAKGEFDESTEMTPDEEGVMFKNAVTSSRVEVGLTNSYALNFLEEGDYEIKFVAYNKTTSTNRFELNALLDSDLKIGGTATEIVTIDAGVSVNVAATIVGLF